MQELIKVATNSQGERVVSARELYEFLGMNNAVFARWSKKNIEENQFAIENEDWAMLNIMLSNGNQTKDYALSLDFSKRISMMARTEKGEQLRNYFIECEKALKATVPVAISIEDALIQQLLVTKAIRIEQEQIRAKQVEQDARILQIEAKTTTRPEYFTVMGYAILQGARVGLSLAAQIGKKAKTICSTKGYHIDKIHDPRFGQVGCYPADVLKEVFNTTTFS
jgi:phage anti-repressor protein